MAHFHPQRLDAHASLEIQTAPHKLLISERSGSLKSAKKEKVFMHFTFMNA